MIVFPAELFVLTNKTLKCVGIILGFGFLAHIFNFWFLKRERQFFIRECDSKSVYRENNTFGTKKIMSETPILKEVVQGDKKVIEKFEKI